MRLESLNKGDQKETENNRKIPRILTSFTSPWTRVIQQRLFKVLLKQAVNLQVEKFSGVSTSGLTKLRPEVTLTLIALTIIAILLNVILSVRCALTKCYFDSLRRGERDHCLGKWLCFERSEPSLPWEKGHRPNQEGQHYSLMLPPSPPLPPPAFYTPYHQVKFICPFSQKSLA
ncbi:unnamed protein product [Rodentolepis nana]|uniref:Ion transport domain-containing protein n=1 Tax=Rodentolepis nana TaxID=102285 RepID=A0A0R3U0C7_RODNA|nr:unnamed protein product [Rodentolepis nana]